MEDCMKEKTSKLLKWIGISLLALIIAAVGILYGMFHHEISTIQSKEKLDEYPLYAMEYDGDYGFDDFLETGASSDKELVDFVVKKLLKGLPIEINIPSLGCSTFLAHNEEGEAIFGRNFDLSYSPAMMVKTKPENAYASISMVNLGFMGYGEGKLPDSFFSSITSLAAPYAPLDGMNEKGLMVGVLLIPTEETNQQSDQVDITTTTAIRMMLDHCATVEEAVAMLKQYDMHSSANSCYHFHIADASGDSVIVEYINNEMKLVEPTENYQAATNFLLTPGDYDFGKGQDRYDTLITALQDHKGVLSESESMELLKAVSQEPHTTDNGSVSSTQWSVVYNAKTLEAVVTMGMNYEQTYHFSLMEE